MEQIPPLEAVGSSNPPIPASNKYKLAFVLDGVVVTTVLTDARSAAIFTSSPTVVQIEPTDPITEGWTYDGNGFSDPAAV
jgi:hypothetical protein